MKRYCAYSDNIGILQVYFCCFLGMAPIRDSVSHSPNPTGDTLFLLLVANFSVPWGVRRVW